MANFLPLALLTSNFLFSNSFIPYSTFKVLKISPFSESQEYTSSLLAYGDERSDSLSNNDEIIRQNIKNLKKYLERTEPWNSSKIYLKHLFPRTLRYLLSNEDLIAELDFSEASCPEGIKKVFKLYYSENGELINNVDLPPDFDRNDELPWLGRGSYGRPSNIKRKIKLSEQLKERLDSDFLTLRGSSDGENFEITLEYPIGI